MTDAREDKLAEAHAEVAYHLQEHRLECNCPIDWLSGVIARSVMAVADAESAHMVETLRLRTAALHRVQRSNDQLRRALARVEALAGQWERDSARLATDRPHYANRAAVDAAAIRAILDGTP